MSESFEMQAQESGDDFIDPMTKRVEGMSDEKLRETWDRIKKAPHASGMMEAGTEADEYQIMVANEMGRRGMMDLLDSRQD